MIGRKKEIDQLLSLYKSNKSEFVAVYGRRRVGKTHLVNEVLGDKMTFSHTAISPVNGLEGKNMLKKQLEAFSYSLSNQFSLPKIPKLKSWFEAFNHLKKCIDTISLEKRVVVFIDELPWLDTPRSFFVPSFENFWNSYGCKKKNLMLIVCGSSTSWILNNLINNRGGLYNRLTYHIKLSPFSIDECKQFYKSNGVDCSNYDLIQSYMIFGGIPYYMNYVKKELSISQNIDNLFFEKNAELKNEFENLFSSIFSNPDTMKKIIITLSKKNIGLTRAEISSLLKLEDGGSFSKYLNTLVESDFVYKYKHFKGKNTTYYKLIDPFCLFYIKFVLDNDAYENHFWINNFESQKLVSWKGHAFENVCFNHIDKIKETLGIEHIGSRVFSFVHKDSDLGCQIDMVILRNDNICNLCEMKFYSDDYNPSKSSNNNLQNKINILKQFINKKASISPVLITTFGLKQNDYSSFYKHTITIKDLID